MAKYQILPPEVLRPLSAKEQQQRNEWQAKHEAFEKTRPCHGQTWPDTKIWMKLHAKPGLMVVVRSSKDTLVPLKPDYAYFLDEIVEIHSSKRFFYTVEHIAHNTFDRPRYYFTGQSHDTPKGQVDVIIPTPKAVAAASYRNQGGGVRFWNADRVKRAVEQTKKLFGVELAEPDQSK